MIDRLREWSARAGIWQAGDICKEAADRIELLQSLLRRVQACDQEPGPVDLPDSLARDIKAALDDA